MKKLLLTSVAGVALIAAGSANAADLRAPVYKAPPPVAAPAPVFSWSGCFVGAHVGWGWGKKDVRSFDIDSEGNLSTAASGKIDTSGAIFGGQVGCDYQFGLGKGFGGGPGAWVIGVQGSIAGTDINGFGADPVDPTDQSLRVKIDSLSSVTGRLGYAGLFPQMLIYVRGGGAWVHERWDLQDASFAFAFETPEVTRTRSGWTVGAGVEWAFAPNWSAFIEWDHYDFGNKNVILASRFDHQFGLDAKERFETVKIGVNYRFNWLFGKAAPVTARY